MAETANSPRADDGDDSAGEKKWLSTAKIGVIVGGIVIFQCALAYHYWPGRDVTATTEVDREAVASASEKPELETPAEENAQQREVDLGRYRLTALDPNSNAMLLIEFHLFGAVAANPSEKVAKSRMGRDAQGSKAGHLAENDDTAIGDQFQQNKHRIRDQVIVIIRDAQLADLTDPGLGLIKRQILAKTNSLLGEPLLREVLFSDFAVVRQ